MPKPDLTEVLPAGEVLRALRAFKKGDFSVRLPLDRTGIAGEIAQSINDVIDLNQRLTHELCRISDVVGKEGKLDQRASIGEVGGGWVASMDAVNALVGDLVQPTKEVGRVIGGVASGDLSQTMALDIDGRPLKGQFLRMAKVVNGMVEQLGSFASEVTRVAREVGTEGKLGGQAKVKRVAGTWKDLTESVNMMAGNLTAQVRNIADVTTAVAKGDLSKKITVDVKGEILELKNTINTMVDQLNGFASEVTRVAREVGTEGKLGGQAQVKGVAGTWKDLTDNVNSMASNLTAQVRNIADVTTAVAKGDLSKKITVDVKGEILELKNTINTMVDQLNSFASEVTRVAREVGTEGKLGGQAFVRGVGGTWKDLTDSVNFMAGNLTAQVRNIADVTTAVANGDLSKKITVDVKGEILELKNTINTMVDQLNAFASEVTRVAREVGTEGKLGGQALVRGVGGTWKDLTDNVNSMATNLTNQVRGIAKVVTAVANGDLERKLALEARGEIAELAETINSMTDTLATFADQVTSVAREVGVEGKLGGQAKVPGAAGTWRDLTDNVNQLAGNLTTQVRAIGDVATAVTKGDLTRSITVEASGEVAALKDNINEMIRNLKDTTQKTTEQDWLKTNLAKFTRMLQGQRDLVTVAQQILSELAPLVTAQHGVFYIAEPDASGEVVLKPLAGYAYRERDNLRGGFRLREGLVGQCAFEKRKILLTEVPRDYVAISSGLGETPPRSLIVLPVIFEGQVNAVIELASVGKLSDIHQTFLDQLTESIGIVVNTIAAGMRTESLLKQSQSLTHELQQQQEQLQTTNEQLEDKAKLLELKNKEIELAKGELEEKAEQLALTSKYKSEFLANMSHELRTPLNSLLILSRMLSENSEANLTEKQVDFAKTIHASGTDLLALISDILDLSKIESGTIAVDPGEVLLTGVRDYVDQNFRHIAQQKGLDFEVELKPGVPRAVVTDVKRLQQVLKNLLANAFKFTEVGRVKLQIGVPTFGWSRDHEVLSRAETVIGFSVTDSGIGIAPEKQKIIFEAFQQADGTTSRKYGGTGLGLSISREIARLLGGEIRVVSEPGTGSTFTLYLPQSRPEMVAGRPTQEMVVPIQRGDDRDQLRPGDRLLLIVEDDSEFARTMLDAAHDRGWKGVIAPEGEIGIGLARSLQPSAIALDLRLPDTDGWTVLDRLKHDTEVRHVPVLMMAAEDQGLRALRMGALNFLRKPADRAQAVTALEPVFVTAALRVKHLLVVDDNEAERRQIVDLIGNHDVETVAVASVREALEALRERQFNCMVLGVADRPGLDALRAIGDQGDLRRLPIVTYTASELDEPQSSLIDRLSSSNVLKEAKSPEHLLNETTLFLHRNETQLPESQRKMLASVRQTAPMLSGATVLVVDDDVRNIFAITSALERHEAKVLFAENGRTGLEMLEQTPDVDVVLMDIMMPEMDGYEVMRRIREHEHLKQLPIIALTAKAMSDDRDKCIAAGASDYIAKPVNIDQLLALLRVWLQ